MNGLRAFFWGLLETGLMIATVLLAILCILPIIFQWFLLLAANAYIVDFNFLQESFNLLYEALELRENFGVVIAIAALIGTHSFYNSLRRNSTASTKISQAKFLTDLNTSYIKNPGFAEIYTHCQDCLDGKCANSSTCDSDTECKLDISRVLLSNYLTFFEGIYLLEKEGSVTFESFNDMYAYRFFLVVHSRFVQKTLLGKEPCNFKNIFRLEKKWIEYRSKQNTVKKKLNTTRTKIGKWIEQRSELNTIRTKVGKWIEQRLEVEICREHENNPCKRLLLKDLINNEAFYEKISREK